MRRALGEGVSVAPGALFSPNGRHGGDMRLNFGHPWTAEMERGVAVIGRLAGSAAPAALLPGPRGDEAAALAKLRSPPGLACLDD